MKILGLVFIFSLFLALAAKAQEQNTLLVDDSLAMRLTIAQPEWQVSRDTFLSPLSVKILYGDRVDLLLQPNRYPGELGQMMFEKKTDIMSPWRLELQEQEKYSTFRTILGSVQIGGAAYLGYLYLKKHGLK